MKMPIKKCGGLRAAMAPPTFYERIGAGLNEAAAKQWAEAEQARAEQEQRRWFRRCAAARCWCGCGRSVTAKEVGTAREARTEKLCKISASPAKRGILREEIELDTKRGIAKKELGNWHTTTGGASHGVT